MTKTPPIRHFYAFTEPTYFLSPFPKARNPTARKPSPINPETLFSTQFVCTCKPLALKETERSRPSNLACGVSTQTYGKKT